MSEQYKPWACAAGCFYWRRRVGEGVLGPPPHYTLPPEIFDALTKGRLVAIADESWRGYATEAEAMEDLQHGR